MTIKTGYRIVLSNGTELNIVLGNEGADTVFQNDDVTVTISKKGLQIEASESFVPKGRVTVDSVQWTEFDVELTQSLDVIQDDKRTCAGSCCITNGCAVCGGGWICDLR